jgi:hypothetical protein
MATRAERFKSTTARNGEAKKKKGAGSGAKSGGAQTPSRAKRMAQASGADDRRYGGPSTAARNLSLGKKAVYGMEDSRAPLRPSRKSTRGGKNRAKAATPLTARQMLKVMSPANQHSRRS